MASIALPVYTETSSRHRSIPKSITTITPTATISKRAAAASSSIKRGSSQSENDLSSLLGSKHEKTFSFNDIPILDTPRRGRRVGKVDLGWESPFPPQEEQKQPLSVSPKKRKVEDEVAKSSSSANVRLIDSEGRASAAIAKLPNSTSLNDSEAFSSSPFTVQSPSKEVATAAATYDALAGFAKEEDAGLSILVPVEVPLMGRMAVLRSQADQIARMDTSILFQSTSGSSEGGTSSSTKLTSAFDDASSSFDPSPSFSLSSHFPASEPNSPSKAYSRHDFLSDRPLAKMTITEKIQALRDAQVKINVKDEIEAKSSSWKPRLDGPGMPRLNWPDSPNGPWSSAGEEVRRLQEQKRRGIARWLEEDSEDEVIKGLSDGHQHPMVAKAMHDRARKEALIRSLSMSHLKMSKSLSPVKKSSSSRRRKMKLETTPKGRGLSAKAVYLHPPPKAIGRLAAYTLTSPSSSSIVGCSCGSTDESTDMVACDACNTWFHLMCIGVAKLTDLGKEWFCINCCDMASNVLSPSTLSDRASLLATPNFPRSAAIAGQQLRLSQGQLPVFAQPSNDSPLIRGELRHQPQHAPAHAYSSALALAPSPPMSSSQDFVDRRTNSGKRHRASRIGWHQVEPGSPLERKSGATPFHRRSMSGLANLEDGTFAGPSPVRRRVPTFEQHHHSTVAPPRTPSPQFNSSSSKSRSTTSSARHYREHSNRDADDIFSTPSRILQGSASWGAPQWQQNTNHSTSMMRHSREDSGLAASHSTPWGLSTPTRFMDTGDFHSDQSEGHGGLPSLVFSSGGLDLSDLTWQLQSPSSSTRAATRARQSSSNRRISAARDKTPTPQSSQGKSSCASSSPFPKTPTFQDLTMMSHHHQQQYNHHHHQSPHSTSSKNLHRLSQQMTPTAANTAANSALQSNYSSAKASSQPKARHVSSGDLMAGLGIGLDLEDVLDWA
jgi:hypothetical protein